MKRKVQMLLAEVFTINIPLIRRFPSFLIMICSRLSISLTGFKLSDLKNNSVAFPGSIRWGSIRERLTPMSEATVGFLSAFIGTTVISPNKKWEYYWTMKSIADEFDGEPSRVSILDGGCGRTSLQFGLAKLGYSVYGIDTVEARPGVWEGYDKSLLTRFGVQIEYKLSSLDAIKYPDNSFDVVMCISVLEHIRAERTPPLSDENWNLTPRSPEDDQLLVKMVREMIRVLKPGGLLILTCDYFIPRDNVIDSSNINIRSLINASSELEIVGEDVVVPGDKTFNFNRLIADSDVDISNYNDRLQTTIGLRFRKRSEKA